MAVKRANEEKRKAARSVGAINNAGHASFFFVRSLRMRSLTRHTLLLSFTLSISSTLPSLPPPSTQSSLLISSFFVSAFLPKTSLSRSISAPSFTGRTISKVRNFFASLFVRFNEPCTPANTTKRGVETHSTYAGFVRAE